ncbi:hypothetical protein Hanom_Chr07g00647001 [Helianthus anomalus]
MIIMYSWSRLPKDHEGYRTSSPSKRYNDHSYDGTWCDELCGTQHPLPAITSRGCNRECSLSRSLP